MLTGELVALLVIDTVPVALPVLLGAKVTFRLADCPGVSVIPEETPLALNPGPDRLTLLIETLEFPELLIRAVRTLLLVRSTFPKLRLVASEVSRSVAAFTVKVAELLVTELTELLTTTENCAPVSAVVVTGVV